MALFLLYLLQSNCTSKQFTLFSRDKITFKQWAVYVSTHQASKDMTTMNQRIVKLLKLVDDYSDFNKQLIEKNKELQHEIYRLGGNEIRNQSDSGIQVQEQISN